MFMVCLKIKDYFSCLLTENTINSIVIFPACSKKFQIFEHELQTLNQILSIISHR